MNSRVENFYAASDYYYGDNNFLICNALLARDCKIMVAALTSRQKFRRAFNIRPTPIFMGHEIFPCYNCALKPEFIMPILRRCIPAPFCAQRALKKKDMQRALNKFTLSVFPCSSRERAREQITFLFFPSFL